MNRRKTRKKKSEMIRTSDLYPQLLEKKRLEAERLETERQSGLDEEDE